jgi:hypothetical protein
MEAIGAADPAAPEALFTFDRLAAASPPLPDFVETSARLSGSSISPHRLTYYFDTGRRGAEVARAAGLRFSAICEALGVAAPPSLLSFAAEEIPGRPEILQVVLGIDAPEDLSRRRAKVYLIFRGASGPLVRRALSLLDAPSPPPSADLDKVYIVGIDLTAAGLDEVKLYVRLDQERLGRVVTNLATIPDLLAGTRYAVFQQCLVRPERRQLYLHATSSAILATFLERRARGGHIAAAALLARQAAINAARPALGLAPWIISFGYREGRIELEASNVYFHLTP